MKNALVLFSGGKDSFLATLKMLDAGYKVNLVTYENGVGLNSKNVLVGARRIVKKYGSDKVKIIGVKNTAAVWRELIKDFYNLESKTINEKYGNITISQFNCLSCRLAMYILSIIICKEKDIKTVVDGARKCQIFAIEQEPMINLFKELFKKYNIEILYPMLEEEDDFSIKNQILAKGFVPKMNEAQCLIGMPVKEISQEVVEGVSKVYSEFLYSMIKPIITKYKDFSFEGEYL